MKLDVPLYVALIVVGALVSACSVALFTWLFHGTADYGLAWGSCIGGALLTAVFAFSTPVLR